MTSDYTFYDPNTGKILLVITADEETLPLYEADYPNAVHARGKFYPEEYYFAEGAMRPRPPSPATWDKTTIALDEVATLSGLPNPTEITITPDLSTGIAPETITVTDGYLRLSTDAPGRYSVVARAFPTAETLTVITVQ